MAPRIAPKLSSPILFAHRGASALAPDNTIESFLLALKLGANGLESDVWPSIDGHAVLAHDDNVGSVVKRQRVTRSTAASLPEHVPTLASLFEVAGCDFELSLDIKHPDAMEPTVNALRAASQRSGTDVVKRTWLCHPDFEQVVAWRSRWSDVRLVHSTRLERLADGPERHASELFEAQIDAVNFRAPDWTGGLTVLYHKFDITCFGWDAHLERVATELLDLGIDAIFSNYVDRMLDARSSIYAY